MPELLVIVQRSDGSWMYMPFNDEQIAITYCNDMANYVVSHFKEITLFQYNGKDYIARRSYI